MVDPDYDYQQNLAFEKSITENKIDITLFNPKNKYLDFSGLGAKVAQVGSLALFKEVENLATTEQVSKFHKEVINWSWARDNIDIIKHLNERDLVSIEEKDIHMIVQNPGTQLLDYVLYDCGYPMSSELEKWLTTKKLEDVIDKFRKRDLLFSLEQDLVEKPKFKRPKI